MAFTTTDLDRIERAIATGELTVTVDGETVTYRSVSDLTKARDMIRGALESSGQIVARPRVSYAARARC